MKNIWIILRKELRSYFVSPIAYGLMAQFPSRFSNCWTTSSRRATDQC